MKWFVHINLKMPSFVGMYGCKAKGRGAWLNVGARAGSAFITKTDSSFILNLTVSLIMNEKLFVRSVDKVIHSMILLGFYPLDEVNHNPVDSDMKHPV